MDGDRCTHGVRYIVGDSPTSRRYDYSEQCPNAKTGSSALGLPRCDEHKARRWLVMLGSSLTVTQHIHDDARGATAEVLARLSASVKRSPDLTRMTARPATDTDIETFELLARQTLESVSVAGPPQEEATIPPSIGGNNDA